jgi:tetrahydromethanopterin S-methyltransferase subunit F
MSKLIEVTVKVAHKSDVPIIRKLAEQLRYKERLAGKRTRHYKRKAKANANKK